MREDFINTCVRRRTWESLCDKHTDTSQLKILLFPPTSDINAITSRNCSWSGRLLVQTHKRRNDRCVGGSRLSVGTREAELSYSQCQRTGEWGISVWALAPITELRTAYRALLCLGKIHHVTIRMGWEREVRSYNGRSCQVSAGPTFCILKDSLHCALFFLL